MSFEFASGASLADSPAGWSPYSLFATDICTFYHAIADETTLIETNKMLTTSAAKIAQQVKNSVNQML
jgi:hypothetical protein